MHAILQLKFKVETVGDIRYKTDNQSSLENCMNPIQLALYYGNKLLLQYFLEQRGESLHLAFIKSDRDEIGMMTICIDRKNLEVFDYLINGYPAHWWSYSRLKSVYDQCINRKWTEGINAIIQGSTLKAVFRSFTVRGRL